jgi:hypothetical protein
MNGEHPNSPAVPSTDERSAGEPETAETAARQPDGSAASPATRSRRQIDGGALAHTPGPWWIERRLGDGLQVNAKHRGEGSSYCVASINHWEGDADRANARLIAAAPDLFAIANELHGEFDQQLYGELSRLEQDPLDEAEFCVNLTMKQIRALNAAILKAEGKAP